MTLEEASAQAEQKLEVAISMVAEKALERVVDRTPVLTGHAAESWHIEGAGTNSQQVISDVPYIKILEFGQHERTRRVFKSGKKKGQVRVARAEQHPHYMVLRTTLEKDEIGREVVEELNG